MDGTRGMLVAVVVGIALIAALAAWMIPEPPQRAVISMERLDVAVLPFANSSTWPSAGETVGARTQARLVQAPGIEVYSRHDLDALLGEQVLGKIGSLDPDTAARIGSLMGVARLIGGTIYSVQFLEQETTICESWADGQCTASVSAIEHSVRVLAQIEVINATTGRMEAVIDSMGEDSVIVRSGTVFIGYDALIAAAADDMARDVASTLTDTYTRELRYGLFRDVERKRDGLIGRDETTRFSATDEQAQADLVIHYTRVKADDEMMIIWLDDENRVVSEAVDVLQQGEWRLYSLNIHGLAGGRYTVVGILNGVAAFEKPFVIEQ